MESACPRYTQARLEQPNNTVRPVNCPDCGSRAIGTLAKIMDVNAYWRCAACGAVWNLKGQRR